jgi:hypothetical protein
MSEYDTQNTVPQLIAYINKADLSCTFLFNHDNNSKLKEHNKMTHCHSNMQQNHPCIYKSYHYKNLTEHQYLNDDQREMDT